MGTRTGLDNVGTALTPAQILQLGCAPTLVGLGSFTMPGGAINAAGPSSPPTGAGIRWTGGANTDIRGINPAGTENGRCHHWYNEGTGTVKFKHQDGANPTAANRILCPENSDYDLKPGDMVTLQYDFTASRWRIVSTAEGE